MLTDWGMEVTLGRTPARPRLTTLRSGRDDGEPFAVALLDRSMPGMDGLALKNAIAADPALTTAAGAHDRPGPGTRPRPRRRVRASPRRSPSPCTSRTLRPACGSRWARRAADGRRPRSARADGRRRRTSADACSWPRTTSINQKVAVAMLDERRLPGRHGAERRRRGESGRPADQRQPTTRS